MTIYNQNTFSTSRPYKNFLLLCSMHPLNKLPDRWRQNIVRLKAISNIEKL